MAKNRKALAISQTLSSSFDLFQIIKLGAHKMRNCRLQQYMHVGQFGIKIFQKIFLNLSNLSKDLFYCIFGSK